MHIRTVASIATLSALHTLCLGSLWGNNEQNPLSWLSGGSRSKQPNIVFILTDDQDLHMNSLDYVPLIRKHLIEQGTLFTKHFCTTAICCPARASILTGMLSHNTNVTDVSPPYGGYPQFIRNGLNDAYLPVWLQDVGYNTYYTGKLFNAHTTDNYNQPFVKGWTQSDFLLDPYTYDYLNSSFQRNQDPPVSYEGQNSLDVLAYKALGFLDDAAQEDKPFFLGIAPVAPHSTVVFMDGWDDEDAPPDISRVHLSPPIPAARHAKLFPDLNVPRTPNFNPDKPSGVHWVKNLEKLTDEMVDYHDHFYRQRLRALQSVDELVESVVRRLEQYDLLDNTYIFYTTDNGYHLGHHRLGPGKECGFEEDINIPLIIRGPGVPTNKTTEIVTTHTDLSPTFLELAGARPRDTFDGLAIPLKESSIEDAVSTRQEHVTVEFWGLAAFEGKSWDRQQFFVNNTYKAVRLVGKTHNLYYSVHCTHEHELYDLNTDPYQINNLLAPDSAATHASGFPIEKIVSRLDSLLFVLKSCNSQTCVRPWEALHPLGNVASLSDALSSRFDDFYTTSQRVHFDFCAMGQVPAAEGPLFNKEWDAFRDDIRKELA
jgi:arylsulfatase A-like enzyme